ncbi:unnamed protein product [Agarophyton chilense]
MLAIPLATTISSLPIAIKAIGELHKATVLQSNALARQGLSTPDKRGEDERLSRQRAGGISGGFKEQAPSWERKVPSRAVAGDIRKDYEVGGLGNATSSRGNLVDILDKVPRKTHGNGDYKKINRPQPRRLPGFGNQSFGP